MSHGEFLRKAIDEDVMTVKQVQQDPAQAATLQIAISHPVSKWQIDNLTMAAEQPH